MAGEPGRIGTWTVRVVVFGGAAGGVGLLVAAGVAEDPPVWWWLAGVPLAVLCGALALAWIRFRLRYRSPEERERAIDALDSRREATGRPLERSRLAHRATKHKKDVLRSGVDGSAVVTFIADGHRANEYRHLVYLELEVTVAGSPPYEVKTGEYLTPASAGSVSPGRELLVKVDPHDHDRVAVDWERSLRLR